MSSPLEGAPPLPPVVQPIILKCELRYKLLFLFVFCQCIIVLHKPTMAASVCYTSDLETCGVPTALLLFEHIWEVCLKYKLFYPHIRH